jgi:hypothetical protein
VYEVFLQAFEFVEVEFAVFQIVGIE